MTRKVQAFLEVIRTTPGVTDTEAARKAGYSSPRYHAHLVRRKWAQAVHEAEVEARRTLKMSADEAEGVVAAVARDPIHRDRLKAAEIMLKLHGKLSEKLQVTVDRPTLNKQLDELLQQMAEQRAVDVAVVQHAVPKELPPSSEADS